MSSWPCRRSSCSIMVLSLLGKSLGIVILVIAILFTPGISRTVRSAVLGEAEREYVLAARLRGERSWFIMVGEVLPNITSPIIVEGTVRLGYCVFAAATLSFLGFGLQPPSPDWGLTISLERNFLQVGLVDRPLPSPRVGLAGGRRQPHRGRLAAGTLAMNADESTIGAEPATTPSPALEVRDLYVTFHRAGRDLSVLRGVSLRIGTGEAYGLVGESGCGKTTVALAVMRYLARNGTVDAGSITVDGHDVLTLAEEDLRAWRGERVAMVYQDPASALNPTMRVGDQIAEVYQSHDSLSLADARDRARESLARVAMPDPDRTHASLSIRALGRSAAARGHRDGAGGQPQTASAR